MSLTLRQEEALIRIYKDIETIRVHPSKLFREAFLDMTDEEIDDSKKGILKVIARGSGVLAHEIISSWKINKLDGVHKSMNILYRMRVMEECRK